MNGWRIRNRNSARRCGFTMIELLVVLAVIGLLTALVLPAVMRARGAARRTQCKNNLRNIGLAVLHEAESQRRFPVAGYWGPIGKPGAYHNWAVQILPWIDQLAIHKQWKFDALLSDPANQDLANRHVPLLACPDDPTLTGAGDLSYVVNGGVGWTTEGCYVRTQFGCIDLNSNGISGPVNTLIPEPNPPNDRELRRRLGVFFCENWPHPMNSEIRHHTPARIRDGAANTIMLSENVHAGVDAAAAGGSGNWASPDPWRSVFYFNPLVCEGLNCAAGKVDYQRANDHSQIENRVAAINFMPTGGAALEGSSPFAASNHAGGVHAVFIDGHVQFLSEAIDGRVYAALLSPEGVAIQGPLAQAVVAEGDY